MVFARWIPSYRIIPYYGTNKYKHSQPCQTSRRVTQVPGSGPGTNNSSQKHHWIPLLFHIKQKTWVLLFFVRRYIYIVRNSIFQNKKKYAGHFGKGANTSFHDLRVFFLKGVWVPIFHEMPMGHFWRCQLCGLRSRNIPHCSKKVCSTMTCLNIQKTKNYVYISCVQYIYILYIYGTSYKILYSSMYKKNTITTLGTGPPFCR